MISSIWKILNRVMPVPCSVARKYSSSANHNSTNSSLIYCLEYLKKYDYENYLCSLLLSKNMVPAAVAIRAFNIELAMVQDMVSEVMIGQMRFQFWENSIDHLYQGIIPDHPVCLQLAKVIQSNELPKMHFKRLISSRRNLLELKTFSNINEVEDYGHLTHHTISQLLLQIADVKLLDSDHASSHLGRALSLANLLRGVPYETRRNRILLPVDLLMKHNVSEEQVFRRSVNKNMKDLTFDVAGRINSHLEKVEKLKKKVDRTSRQVFLPSVCVGSYLKRLRSVDFNIFHPKLQQRNHFLCTSLFLNKVFF